MECQFNAARLRMLLKLFVCLSKVNEEVYFDIGATGWKLRTLNSSQSVFAAFKIDKEEFFDYYRITDNRLVKKFKVLSRSCIQICKSTSSVDSCHCRLTTGKEPHLVFELTSIGGQLRKQHILRIEECEVFQAVYNRNSTLLRVVTEANPIVECLSTLGSKMDDCQLTLLAEGLQMASPLPSTPAFLGGFSSSASASEKTHVQLRSETVLERSAFVEYPSGQAEHLPLTVTVGTKALKAALLLWEQWNCRVELCLSSPGAPMLLAMCDSVAGMQGEVLIATVDCSRLEREDPSQLLPPKSKQPTSPFPSLTHPTASGSGSVSVSGGRGRGLSPPLSPPPMGDNRDSDSDSEGGDLVGPTPSPTPP